MEDCAELILSRVWYEMKKTYVKPTLTKQQALAAITSAGPSKVT